MKKANEKSGGHGARKKRENGGDSATEEKLRPFLSYEFKRSVVVFELGDFNRALNRPGKNSGHFLTEVIEQFFFFLAWDFNIPIAAWMYFAEMLKCV
ncbi:MAG: hypothetical protein JXD19_12600 [Deltaproteobacteria bacterium]|nr:hypothetical protein [Deltaproteobacteria bacterium]